MYVRSPKGYASTNSGAGAVDQFRRRPTYLATGFNASTTLPGIPESEKATPKVRGKHHGHSRLGAQGAALGLPLLMHSLLCWRAWAQRCSPKSSRSSVAGCSRSWYTHCYSSSSRPRASFAGDSVRVALPATDSLQPAADALPDDGRRSTLWAARVTRLVIHRCGPRDAEGERRILALRNAS